MNKENRDFKGVWIPKEIWLNTDLSIIEKVLLVEIDSLDNSDRGCFASNEYLAKFVQLSEGRVANIISDLKKRKYILQIFFDGRNRGLRINKSESSVHENVKAESTKTGKQTTRKREYNNTDNKTSNNTSIIIENPSEFSHFEKITIDEKQSSKEPLNPFTIVKNLEIKPLPKSSAKKVSPAPDGDAPRQMNKVYEAFTVFCQTFESLSGAAYPTDNNGHYIMIGKDAGSMTLLIKYIEKIDRNNNTLEALRIFVNAAWNLNDKWIKANFTVTTLYSQASKIFTAFQTTSPVAQEKKKWDRIQELLAERMAKFQD